MPVIGWNESQPADTDSAGLGDDQIRSLKTSVRVGLDGEHVWPSGGGDAGVHRLGSARVAYNAQSLVSSAGTDGRLMQTSDTSRLFHTGSGGTSFIGGPTVISAGSFPGTVPQRAVWVEEFGEGRTASGSTTITIPNSGYSGVPFIFLTLRVTSLAADGGAAIIWPSGVGPTTFAVSSRLTDGATISSHSFYWRSIGSRTL